MERPFPSSLSFQTVFSTSDVGDVGDEITAKQTTKSNHNDNDNTNNNNQNQTNAHHGASSSPTNLHIINPNTNSSIVHHTVPRMHTHKINFVDPILTNFAPHSPTHSPTHSASGVLGCGSPLTVPLGSTPYHPRSPAHSAHRRCACCAPHDSRWWFDRQPAMKRRRPPSGRVSAPSSPRSPLSNRIPLAIMISSSVQVDLTSMDQEATQRSVLHVHELEDRLDMATQSIGSALGEVQRLTAESSAMAERTRRYAEHALLVLQSFEERTRRDIMIAEQQNLGALLALFGLSLHSGYEAQRLELRITEEMRRSALERQEALERNLHEAALRALLSYAAANQYGRRLCAQEESRARRLIIEAECEAFESLSRWLRLQHQLARLQLQEIILREAVHTTEQRAREALLLEMQRSLLRVRRKNFERKHIEGMRASSHRVHVDGCPFRSAADCPFSCHPSIKHNNPKPPSRTRLVTGVGNRPFFGADSSFVGGFTNILM